MPDEAYSPRIYPNARTGSDDQWLRRWDLTLYRAGAGGSAVTITTQTEGHDFRMVFKIRHAEQIETNQTAEIRIYNLSRDTARDVIREFDRVVLQAGYMTGRYGMIFSGTIKYYKIGRESAVDGYLDIYAAAADKIGDGFMLGSTADPYEAGRQNAEAIKTKIKEQVEGLQDGEISQRQRAYWLARGKVDMASLKHEAREYMRSTRTSWFVQNDKLSLLPKTGYARGDIVVINSGTGLIGAVEQTTNGLNLTCLLNPNLYVLGRVQLDQREINQYFRPGEEPLAAQPGGAWRERIELAPVMAPLTADGTYTIRCIDHTGDTRGQPWYSHLLCSFQNPDRPWDSSSDAGSFRPR